MRAHTCLPVLLLLCGVGWASGCSSRSDAGEPDSGQGPVHVAVSPVSARSISRVLTYPGDVAGEVEVNVFSTVPDRIVALRVEEGDQVRRNDVIAIVRADALGQGVEQALGALGAVRAQVDGLRDTLERQQRLLASGVVTQAQVDATAFQLRAAESQAAQLDATVGSARTRRSDAVVRAPIDGIIGQVNVEEGDLAAPQIPICTVVQMDRVEVRIQVSENELGLIRPGLEAEITFASLPGVVRRAPISRVSPVVDRRSRTALLRIMLDNEDRAIRPGNLASVRLEVERHDNALVVPQYALILDARSNGEGGAEETTYRAYVVDGGVARERRVRVGFHDGNDVEAVEGLRQGDRLVVQGQHLVQDGHPVVVEEPERPSRPRQGQG